jgi:transposase
MVPVGERVTEELDVEPPRFSVIEHVQIEYGCPDHMNGSISAPLPPRPIENGRPSASLLAFIVVQKYVDHLPLYRQEGIFKRSGIHLPRSTMNEWLGRLCELLAPIVAAIKRRLLASRFLQSDDTPIRFIDRGVKGKTRRGYL